MNELSALVIATLIEISCEKFLILKVSVLSMPKESKVLLYADHGDNPRVNDIVQWLFYDPLIISQARLKVDVKKSIDCKGVVAYPNLSEKVLSNYDLVVIPQGDLQHIKQEYLPSIISYLEDGGALFVVQPTMDDFDEFSDELGRAIGVRYEGWIEDTSYFSVITDNPLARILGLSVGEIAYPHRDFWGHMKFSLIDAQAITRLESNSDPDLIISNKYKIAIFATDVFDDLLHYRHHPEYDRYRENLFYLVINVLQHLLGLSSITNPLPRHLRRWSNFFWAYAVGKNFVHCTYKEFKDKVSWDEIKHYFEKSEEELLKAAKNVVNGNFDKAWREYCSAVRCLSECMKKITKVRRYILRGWHGGILFDEFTPNGGLLGYAEFCWSDWTVRWMMQQLDWISLVEGRRVSEICGQVWEILAKYYPEEIKRIREALKKGLLEQVGGLYSYSYLLIFSPESNIRQFKYGLKAIKDVLGTDVVTYHVACDHFAFHPQLPQILKGFGFKYATLRCGHPGQIRAIHGEKIYWQGLNGTVIEAIPTYSDVRKEKVDVVWSPRQIRDAEKAGYKTILIGEAIDATMRFPFAEKEHTILNSIASIIGKMSTFKEYFEETPKPTKTIYFSVDDLYGKPDFWSGFGIINKSHHLHRRAEVSLLIAERFETIAYLLDAPSLERFLEQAWKKLLIAQDHFLYGGCGPYEGQYTGSFYIGRFPNYQGPMMLPSGHEKIEELLNECYKIAIDVLGKSLRHISSKIKTGIPSESTNYIPIIVFNPLIWERKDVVPIKLSFPKGKVHSFSIFDGEKYVPYQILKESRYEDNSIKDIELLLIAKVPAFGYRTYYLKCNEKDTTSPSIANIAASGLRIENKYYVLELEPHSGCIKSIYDKELGLEIIDEMIGRGNEIVASPSISSQNQKAQIDILERGPIRATLRIKGHLDKYPYECLISLYNDIKRIDFTLQIDYGKGASFGINREVKTNLRVNFPLKIGKNRNVKVYIDQPFGVYETKMPQRHEVQVSANFVDIQDDKYGVLFVHRSTPGFYYDGKNFSIILADAYPPISGIQKYCYCMHTHNSKCPNSYLLKMAEEFNYPLIYTIADVHDGVLPSEKSFFVIDKSNIMLSAIFHEVDKVYVRVYEIDGLPTRVKMKIPEVFSKAHMVELSGNVVKELQISNGSISFYVNPFQITTIALRRKK